MALDERPEEHAEAVAEERPVEDELEEDPKFADLPIFDELGDPPVPGDPKPKAEENSEELLVEMASSKTGSESKKSPSCERVTPEEGQAFKAAGGKDSHWMKLVGLHPFSVVYRGNPCCPAKHARVKNLIC